MKDRSKGQNLEKNQRTDRYLQKDQNQEKDWKKSPSNGHCPERGLKDQNLEIDLKTNRVQTENIGDQEIGLVQDKNQVENPNPGSAKGQNPGNIKGQNPGNAKGQDLGKVEGQNPRNTEDQDPLKDIDSPHDTKVIQGSDDLDQMIDGEDRGQSQLVGENIQDLVKDVDIQNHLRDADIHGPGQDIGPDQDPLENMIAQMIGREDQNLQMVLLQFL
jgi:hypothetical protein